MFRRACCISRVLRPDWVLDFVILLARCLISGIAFCMAMPRPTFLIMVMSFIWSPIAAIW